MKIHSDFILSQSDVIDVLIKNNINICTGDGNIVKTAKKGEKYSGYIVGDYFFID